MIYVCILCIRPLFAYKHLHPNKLLSSLTWTKASWGNAVCMPVVRIVTLFIVYQRFCILLVWKGVGLYPWNSKDNKRAGAGGCSVFQFFHCMWPRYFVACEPGFYLDLGAQNVFAINWSPYIFFKKILLPNQQMVAPLDIIFSAYRSLFSVDRRRKMISLCLRRPKVVARGIMFSGCPSIRLTSVCPSVRPSVCPWHKFVSAIYLNLSHYN